MRIFNTICKKCGKHCDEDMDHCFRCGSKSIYYQSDLTKQERKILETHKN